ncbi:MAG: hypothetical protein ACP5M0_14325 [Desulfomonilaceae bacterium]
MDTYGYSAAAAAHKDKKLQWQLRKEIDVLSAKKEALDSEYPRHARQIPGLEMRCIAYRSLLERLCRPSAEQSH